MSQQTEQSEKIGVLVGKIDGLEKRQDAIEENLASEITKRQELKKQVAKLKAFRDWVIGGMVVITIMFNLFAKNIADFFTLGKP